MHEEGVPHARREFLHQVSVGRVLANAWRRDLPSASVPVRTPGHTGGHCAYHRPDLGVLVSGDSLVTAHPTSRIHGPQLLPDIPQ
jgi:hypothetical protein